MKKHEFYAIVKPILKREFNLQETLKLLQLNKTIFWSWGANSFINYDNKGLLFKVSGMIHKGSVLITLAWDDTYTVDLFNTQGTHKKTLTNIYFDDLVNRIDSAIEKIDAYEF